MFGIPPYPHIDVDIRSLLVVVNYWKARKREHIILGDEEDHVAILLHTAAIKP